MKVVCSWCGCTKAPSDGESTVLEVSHGICASCAKKFEAAARAKHRRDLIFARFMTRRCRSVPACQIAGGL